MTPLPFQPRFDYGASTLSLTLPSRIWRFSDMSIGGGALSAVRTGASYVVVRDQLLNVTLRFYESEWASVLAMLQYGQAWPNTMTFYPDKLDTGTSYVVQLRHPMMGEPIDYEEDSEYPEVKEREIQLHKVSGVPWTDTWFT